MTEIIFATGNKDKMREIREIMADCDVHIVSMKEAGIRVDIVEDGTTFEENAKIKARAVAAHTDAIVLADDSGLEIDALNKEPGVYSARYMGEDTSYDVKNKNLIDRLCDCGCPSGWKGTGDPSDDGRIYRLGTGRGKRLWV